MGLISRVVEAAGVPTIALSINLSFSEKVPAPRNGYVKFPYGAPFGEPHAVNQQFAILRDLLRLLQTADTPGALVELPHHWKRTRYDEIDFASFEVRR